MKHNYSSTLSALLLLLVSTLSWAADFKKDRIYYNINDDGTSVEVTFGTDTRRPDTKEYTGDIVIPSTVKHKGKTYSVTSIGKSAFSDCTSLASVDIPEGVTSIGDCVFNRCTSLNSISLPESLRSIGDHAFCTCISLKSIDIPESVTSIGDCAFEGCTSLTSITVAPGNSVYDSRQGCNAIIETKTNTLVTGCRNTVIPESVTCIGYNAFRGCYALESIDIPEGVRYIGEYTFERCASLAKVICRAERVPYASNGAFLRTPIGKAKLYVPASSIEAYKAANGWKGFGTILPLEDDKSNTE